MGNWGEVPQNVVDSMVQLVPQSLLTLHSVGTVDSDLTVDTFVEATTALRKFQSNKAHRALGNCGALVVKRATLERVCIRTIYYYHYHYDHDDY